MTKKTFMMFALLCLTFWGLGGMGAWAQTAPEGLSIDSDYSSDQEGYYYVNIQSTQVGQSITFTETDLAFKVYDDGGKNGNNGKRVTHSSSRHPMDIASRWRGRSPWKMIS